MPEIAPAVELDHPRRHRIVAARDIDEGRFARAVGAEQPEDLAAPQFEIDAAQRLHALEGLAHAPGAQQHLAGAGHRPWRHGRPARRQGRRTRGRCDRPGAAPRVPPLQGLAEQPFRHEEDHDDQHQPGQALADDRGVAAREGIEQQRDRGGADDRAGPVPRAAEHRHQHHRERQRDREGVAGGHIGDEQRLHAADHARQAAGQREGAELVAEGRHAHHLGDVLVVVDREQAGAEARVVDHQRGHHRRQRDGQRQQIEGARGGGTDRGHRHRAHVDARAAVDRRVEDERRDHEGGGQGQQREQLGPHRLDPEGHRAQQGAEQRGHQAGGRQGPQERDVEAGRQVAVVYDADAEEGAVAEREIAGVARQQVPRGGERDPVQHQVEDRLVEGRQPEPRHRWLGPRRPPRITSSERFIRPPSPAAPAAPASAARTTPAAPTRAR